MALCEKIMHFLSGYDIMYLYQPHVEGMITMSIFANADAEGINHEQAKELIKKLTPDQLADVLVNISKMADRTDMALKLIAEDASRNQKDRLPLIQRIAEKQRNENSISFERNLREFMV